MPRRVTLPLLATSLPDYSKVRSNTRLTNMYLATDKRLGRQIAKGTPGLTEWLDLGGTKVQALFVHSGNAYALASGVLYKITSNKVVSNLGTAALGSRERISWAATNEQVIFADGNGGRVLTVSSGAIESPITDSDYENSIVQVAATSNYALGLVPDSDQVDVSSLNDVASWVSTSYKESDKRYDNNVSIIVNNELVWVFGEVSTEIWYDSGAGTVPFDNAISGTLSMGCAAAESPAVMNNVTYWLAQDDKGLQGLVRSSGADIEKLMPEEIVSEIATYESYSDAFSWTCTIDGHDWYVLTFPTKEIVDGITLGTSWVFDATSNSWFEWKSLYTNTDLPEPTYTRHRANCHMFFNGEHIVGDYESGKLYKLDPYIYTDDGEIIESKVVTSMVDYRGSNLAILGLRLEVENAVANEDVSDPQIMIRYSKDYGRTWSNTLYRDLGQTGEYNKEVRVNSLGTGKNFTLEVSITDPVQRVIVGADAVLRVER